MGMYWEPDNMQITIKYSGLIAKAGHGVLGPNHCYDGMAIFDKDQVYNLIGHLATEIDEHAIMTGNQIDIQAVRQLRSACLALDLLIEKFEYQEDLKEIVFA